MVQNESWLGKGGCSMVQGLKCRQIEAALTAPEVPRFYTWSHWQCVLEHRHAIEVPVFD